MRRSVQPSCPRAMTWCFFASLKMLAMPAQGPWSPSPRQRLERLLPMAGFQVSIYGRFWVSTEADMLRQFSRWLYRGHRPNALARWINRGTAAVFARGVAPNYFVMLEVVGRRSGRPISFPLVMAVVDGERYLVSMLGADVAWVQNVKAASGRAVLRHGRTAQVRRAERRTEKRAPAR